MKKGTVSKLYCIEFVVQQQDRKWHNKYNPKKILTRCSMPWTKMSSASIWRSPVCVVFDGHDDAAASDGIAAVQIR